MFAYHSPNGRANGSAEPHRQFAHATTTIVAATATIAATIMAIVTIAPAARAQSYTLTTLVNLDGSTTGIYPEGGVTLDASGNIYGTTSEGPSLSSPNLQFGSVFKIAAGTNTFTTLAIFDQTNGATPQGNLTLDGSGNLYGTTISDYGTAFTVATGTGTLTTLASFYGNTGTFPYGGVVLDSSGNAYGTTSSGGTNSCGTVYEIASGSGTITTLASFDGTTNGQYPEGGLVIDSSGNLYGTTTGGGANNEGTVFEVAAGSGTITTLATFSQSIGGSPLGNLALDASGNVYGTTSYGGTNGYGTVFEVAAGSGTVTVLANFDGTNGYQSLAGVTLDSSGNLFGTTSAGGANNEGTVFEVAAGSGTITTLVSFDGTNGYYPVASVTLDSSGNIYGTTYAGGTNDYGTVFELSPTP